MVCNRTNGCTKAAGHQGFCSGHKGFKKREGPGGALTGRHALRVRPGGPRGPSYDSYDEDEEWYGSGSEDEYAPSYKKARKTPATTPRADDPLVSLLCLLDA